MLRKEFNLGDFLVSIMWTITVLATFIFCVNISTGSLFAQEEKIRIGILCINTPTGNQHEQGIKNVLEKNDFSRYLDIKPYRYAKVSDGFEMLKDWILKSKKDIILGPTESDIFVDAVDLGEELSDKKVPVISGLVTAKVGNEKDGWFFRTNVDVNRRVHKIFDYLNKHWITTITVIYADTQFGRWAERAFRNELKLCGDAYRCSSLLYDTPPNPRKQLYTIFENRPEAVGIFGEREDVENIYRQFKTMNHSFTPYNPLFFTILDVRSLQEQAKEEPFFYFVSVVESEGKAGDSEQVSEAKALGHDLGKVVLQVLKDMNGDGKLFTQKFDESKRVEFRKQLVTLMSHSQSLNGKLKTRMIFNKLENVTLPGIYQFGSNKVEEVPMPDCIGFWSKLGHRIKLVYSVYGFWIYAALTVIFILAFSISRMEITRLFPAEHIKIYRAKSFYFFTIGHFLVVVIIYIFLCEFGSIKYDDILMVIIISLTPSAFLRTTFFETKYGKAIGLEGFYKNIMLKIEDSIMRARYASLEALKNVIAYNNSLDSIRKSLLLVYNNHPSLVQRAKLIQKMEEDLNREPEYLNKRRIGASLLMRQFDRDLLKAEGFVPQDWDYDKYIDPRIIIRMVAHHCAKDPEKIKEINSLLDAQLSKLKKRNPERFKEMDCFIKKERRKTINVEGLLIVNIRNLFVLMGYDIKWLIDNNFLDENALNEKLQEIEDSKKIWWKRLYTKIKKR